MKNQHLKSDINKNADYLKYTTYFSYVYACLKNTSLWGDCKRAVKYIRRYLLVSRLIRYTAIIISIIETSAVLILIFSALIIILPIILVSVLSVIVICFIQYKKHEKEIENSLLSSKLYIFFHNEVLPDELCFLSGFADELSKQGTVFIVLSAFSSARFLTLLKKNDIFIIKLHYFYYLKFTQFKKISDKITYIF